MIAVLLTGLLGFCGFLCQSKAEDPLIAQCLQQLRSDDASERDRATQQLMKLAYAKSVVLKEALGKERDAEVASRLREVLKHLTLKESDALWADGKLQESLLRFAEAEGAAKPEEYVRERLQRTKREILEAYPRPDEGKINAFARDRRIVGLYGRWAVSFILEELGKDGGEMRIPAVELLRLMEDDVIPHLCESLRSSNRLLQSHVCELLKSMPRGWSHRNLPSALEHVLKDSEAEERTKESAKWILDFIKLLPKKQDK